MRFILFWFMLPYQIKFMYPFSEYIPVIPLLNWFPAFIFLYNRQTRRRSAPRLACAPLMVSRVLGQTKYSYNLLAFQYSLHCFYNYPYWDFNSITCYLLHLALLMVPMLAVVRCILKLGNRPSNRSMYQKGNGILSAFIHLKEA